MNWASGNARLSLLQSAVCSQSHADSDPEAERGGTANNIPRVTPSQQNSNHPPPTPHPVPTYCSSVSRALDSSFTPPLVAAATVQTIEHGAGGLTPHQDSLFSFYSPGSKWFLLLLLLICYLSPPSPCFCYLLEICTIYWSIFCFSCCMLW